MAAGPRILLLDIETTDLKADENIILCMGYKWLGDKKIQCPAVWDYKDYQKGSFTEWDYELCKTLAPLFIEADVIVGHYAAYFDTGYINARLRYHGFDYIPKNVKTIDTCLLSRSAFKLRSNRLANLCKFFKLKNQKGYAGGFRIWVEAMIGRTKAQDSLVTYCKQDVACLEEYFTEIIRPRANVPNYNLWHAGIQCPSCGGLDLVKRGFKSTKTSRFQRVFCNECRSWSQLNVKETKAQGV